MPPNVPAAKIALSVCLRDGIQPYQQAYRRCNVLLCWAACYSNLDAFVACGRRSQRTCYDSGLSNRLREVA